MKRISKSAAELHSAWDADNSAKAHGNSKASQTAEAVRRTQGRRSSWNFSSMGLVRAAKAACLEV